MSQYSFKELSGSGITASNKALDGISYLLLHGVSVEPKALGFYNDFLVRYRYDETNDNTANPENIPNVVIPNDNSTGFGAWLLLGIITTGISATSPESEKPLSSLENTNPDGLPAIREFYKNSASPLSGDVLGEFSFYGNDSAGNKVKYAKIRGYSSDVADGDEAGELRFYSLINNSEQMFFRMRGLFGGIAEAEIVFNENGNDIDFRIEASGEPNAIALNGASGAVQLGAYGLGVATFDASGNLTSVPPAYGEAYVYENSVAVSIEAVEQWHPGTGFTAGLLGNWTFDAGGSIDILSFSDYSGTVAGTIKATTDGAHGYSTGDIVVIVGANVEAGDVNPYYGIYEITVVSSTEYYFTNSNWNATTTAVSILPTRLIAGANAAGIYSFKASGSVKPAGTNKVLDLKLFQNINPIDKVENRISLQVSGNYANIPGSCLLDISIGDQIWFAVKNLTDSTDITMRYGNFSLKR